MSTKATEIRQLLDQACGYDEQARTLRRAAGRKLAELQRQFPTRWHQMSGIPADTAKLLIHMARGTKL